MASSTSTEPRVHEVKHLLHKEVFHPNGERLVAFTKVAKTEPGFMKKENTHYLCCSVTVKRPSMAFISRYRKNDNGEGYQQRRRWPLEELSKVDGHSATASTLLFDLYFDRAFKFEATSFQDKEGFLESIAELCGKYLKKMPPPFVNVTAKINSSLPSDADVKRLMERNRQQLGERGEKLSQLDKKTAEMADSSQAFSNSAHKISDKYRS